MYGQQGMGYNAIAYRLNDLHIPARKGEWSQTSVVNILNNEVYLGKIRWRREPVKRIIKDGSLTKKRIQNDDYEIYEGRHEPIISQEQWDRVKVAQKDRNHTPVNIERQVRNPFSGILRCEKCGKLMRRNIPQKTRTPTAWYQCATRGCDCKIVKCETIENAIVDAMAHWLKEYTIQIDITPQNTIDPVDAELEAISGQLEQLRQQQNNICEYLEKGVYSIDMFTKRNATLTKEIQNLERREAELTQKRNEGIQNQTDRLQIIPVVQGILNSYPLLSTAEKNRLWKLVLKSATIYRSQDDVLAVHIYPNLPS